MDTQNDPSLLPAAERIADEFAASKPLMSGKHTPISWRITEDDRLCVVLESGPKLFGPVEGKGIIRRAADAAVDAFKQLTSMDEREATLDEREARLNARAAELEAQAATLAEQTSTKTGEDAEEIKKSGKK